MKKLLSSFLAFCMILSMITIAPLTAQAAYVPSNANLLNTYGNVFNYVGNALVAQELLNPSILNAAAYEYNSITVGNEMKPDYVLGWSSNTVSVAQARSMGYYIPSNYRESTVPVLDYSTVDKMMKACYEKGLSMRGHTLLWHAQTPDWFFRAGYQKNTNYVDKDTMTAREEYFIRNYLGHCCSSPYASIIYAWDVVNEYIHAPNNQSGWQKIYGNNLGPRCEFVKNAFKFAYATLETYKMTDQVHLFYNDFNTYMDSDKIVDLVKYVNAEKKICAGVGMQSHLSTSFPSVAYYKSALQKFCNNGFEVQITELDVGASDDNAQANYYYDLMKAILDVKKSGGNITALVWWGMSDDTSWRDDRPLLYRTRNGQKKPSYTKVLEAYFDSGYTKVQNPGKPSQIPTTPAEEAKPAGGAVTAITDGWYYIKNVSSGKYLTVDGNNAGANVEIYSFTGTENQRWKVTSTSDGYFTLTSGVGNYMMDIAYGKDEDGANIGIYNAYSGEAQQFTARATSSSGVFTLGTKVSNSSKAIDVNGNKKTDGTNIIQWTYNGNANQQFIFETVGGQSTEESKPAETVKPTEESKPAETVKPTEESKPAETVKPTEESKPAETVKPTEESKAPAATGNNLTVSTVVNNWGSGGQVSFKITNKGTSTVNTWKLKVKKSDVNIQTSWNVNIKESGDYYVITPVSWNKTIQPGNTVEFGCIGLGNVNTTITCTVE